MRILCVTNLFPNALEPTKGIFNWRLLSLMHEQVPVRVISPVLWVDDLRSVWKRGASLRTGTWGEWEGVGVVYPRYYYTPWILRRFYGVCFQLSIRRAFLRAVADFRPDLIFASWAYPDGWAACRLAREVGLPVVVKTHGSDLLLLDEYPQRRRGTVELLEEADAIITVGKGLRDRAVELGAAAERTHVVYAGTDHDLFCPGNRSNARRELGMPVEGHRLLFVGNLVPVKAVDNLVEACRRLVAKGLTVDADIVGEGPLRSALERQIAAAGLTARVHLRGRRLPHQLPVWYHAADLVVLCSNSEGIPNVLVEAAACGTPFVATAVGGIPEIAHLSPGRLVPPRDPGALADSIASLLSNSGRAAYKTDTSNVPSVVDAADRTLQIFSELLATRKTLASPGHPSSTRRE